MWSLVAINALLIVAALVVTAVIPPRVLSAALHWFHVSLGITAPRPENAVLVALIWIGSMVAIVDGLALLLVWLT